MTTEGKAWTVIQRRKDGSENFARSWADYERGFGDPNGEFWLGLTALHALTAVEPSSLRVDLWDFEGGHRFAQYDSFRVGGAEDNYRLSVSGYTGNAGDSLTRVHNSQPFSTKDRDNDRRGSSNCATDEGGGGGWWYWSCDTANLNGRYIPEGGYRYNDDGVEWNAWPGHPQLYSYMAATMMVRPKN